MVSSLTTFYTQIVPMVIVGDGWSQRIVLLDVDTTLPVIGTLRFYSAKGQPWQVQMRDQGTAASFPVNLQPGQTVIFETLPKTSTQQLGWALLELTIDGLGDVFGQTIISKKAPGMPDLMSSMVFGGLGFQKLSTFFDNTAGNSTAMGILSSQPCLFGSCPPSQFQVTVRGLDGAAISQKTINQDHGALYSMDLASDFPETAGRMGTFTVELLQEFTTTLTGYSLQFAASGGFTVVTPFEQ